MNETYLYPYSAKEARERNELSLWRKATAPTSPAVMPSRIPSAGASTECI
ncbi:MAG: hypothetical protein ACLU3I_19090 [Acutalibacteraceae bacterium]